MNIRQKSKKLNKAAGKIRSNGGMTMIELLSALVIVMLVSAGMVTGVRLGYDQFAKSMRSSECKVLYSTLSSIIGDQLRYTKHVVTDDNGNVTDFEAVNIGEKSYDTESGLLKRGFFSVDSENHPMTDHVNGIGDEGQDTFGEICYGMPEDTDSINKLLGSASYHYDLTAKVDAITYDETKHIFTVNLSIGYKQEEMYEHEFQVMNIPKTKVSIE